MTVTAFTRDPDAEIAAANDWPDPQPLPTELPDVPTFDPDLLPDSFRPLVIDGAERLQCPPDFIAAPIMTFAGAVIGRQIGIKPLQKDDWLVIPNLWGFNVGRPGLLKTPATETATKLILRLEIEAKEQFELAVADHEIRARILKAKAKQDEVALRKRLKEGQTVDEIAAALSKDADDEAPPTRRRYTTNDSTVEQLQVLLRDNPTGILIVRDELPGWLRNLDKDGREGARAFFLEAWNGNSRFSYDTIGRGTIDIEAACVSVFGNIQPGPLETLIRSASKSGAGDDGLLQRFQMAVWPDASKEWQQVDRWPDGAAKQLAFDTFHCLAHLGGAPVDGRIPFRRFAPDAQALFDEWRAELELELRSGELHPSLEGHLAKYRSLVPALALICSLADDEPDEVSVESTLRAIAWAGYLRGHAIRIWSSALAPELGAAIALSKHILKGDLETEFAFRDVYRKRWAGLTDRTDIEAAISMLGELDWLKTEARPTATKTATVHVINPKLKGLNHGS